MDYVFDLQSASSDAVEISALNSIVTQVCVRRTVHLLKLWTRNTL